VYEWLCEYFRSKKPLSQSFVPALQESELLIQEPEQKIALHSFFVKTSAQE